MRGYAHLLDLSVSTERRGAAVWFVVGMEEEARDAGRPETVHSAEQGERGAVEESGEDESAAFETSAYWDGTLSPALC